MLAKYGLILLILLATTLAFVAGALLPGESPLPAAAPTDTKQSGAAVDDATAGDAATADTAGPAATDPSKDDKTKAEDDAVPYADLTLPNVLPDKAELALQIGLFIDARQADPLTRRLDELGQGARLLAVTDPNGARWQLLVAGPYATLDEARTQRLALRRGLDLRHAPSILLLPPPKKPPPKD